MLGAKFELVMALEALKLLAILGNMPGIGMFKGIGELMGNGCIVMFMGTGTFTG